MPARFRSTPWTDSLAWKVEITERAVRQIRKLGPSEAARVGGYLRSRVAPLDDPRRLGKPLRGSEFGNFWRYRVGDIRILCEIHDDTLTVLVVAVGHRRSIYR